MTIQPTESPTPHLSESAAASAESTATSSASATAEATATPSPSESTPADDFNGVARENKIREGGDMILIS